MVNNSERETVSGKGQQTSTGQSSTPLLNELFRFEVPQAEEKEVVIYRDKKGVLHARLADELEKL